MSPTFGTSGVQGGGCGPMKMIFASTADSLYSVLHNDWILTLLTLDIRQVNDIWKDGLGRVSTVHPTPSQHTRISPMYVGWSEALATLAKCLTNVVNQSIFTTEKVKKYTLLRTLHYVLCVMGRTKQPIIEIIVQNVARTLTLAQCLTNVVNQSIFKCFIITPKVKKHTM